MPRYRVLPFCVILVAAIVAIVQSEWANPKEGYVMGKRPIGSDGTGSFRSRKEPRQSAPLFLLHLLKLKPHYQRIEKVPTTTPTTDCICVPYYLCDANMTIITDGVGTIDIRYRRCTGDLEVCCRLPKVTAAPIVTPTVTTTTTMRPTTPTTPPTTPTTPPTTPTTPTTTTTTMKPTTPTTTTPTTTTTQPTTPTTTTTTTTTTTLPPIVFPSTIPTAPPTIFPPGLPNLNCICVYPSQCDPNGIINIYGEGIIDPRQQLNLCPQPGQVCCRLPLINIPTSLPIIPTTGTSPFCIVCGSVVQCTNGGYLIPSGSGTVISPRSQAFIQNNCGSINQGCCQGTNVNLDVGGIFGALKNPGTAQACYCVKSWFCTAGNAVSIDGAGVIDPRFTLCPAADEVCCRPTGIDLQVLRALPDDVDALIVNNDSQPGSGKIECGVANNSLAPATPFPPDTGKTYYGEFPWMAILLVKPASGPYVFKCGGSLISTKAVLTAAHCVANRDFAGTLIARVGLWDMNVTSDSQERKVQTIVTHPNFYSSALYHDVAVLILETPVKYDFNVRPICLPEQGMTFVAGSRCYGTGWGRNSFGPEGQYQTQLRKVDLPIVDRGDCQNRLRTTRLGPYFQLHGSFICAGGEANRDTCSGDGGGPLVCEKSTNQYVQAGIVAWGIGCGETNVPAVYASVSLHRQWIDQQLATYGAQ